jgi:hypothetical protein
MTAERKAQAAEDSRNSLSARRGSLRLFATSDMSSMSVRAKGCVK